MIKRFVFHHINKCAGTTLHYLFQNQFDHARCLFMERYSPALPDRDYPEFEEISRATFVHEPFGMRDWKSILPNVTDFAMFRDPIARVRSQWKMIARWSDLELQNNAENQAMRCIARAGFRQFLTSDHPMVVLSRWNGLTGHLLMGDQAMVDRWRALDGLHDARFARNALELAISNLHKLDLIGLVERFNESYEALAVLFPFAPENTIQSYNLAGSGREELDSETRGAAEDANALDAIVYAEALHAFERQVVRLKAEFGPDLKVAAAARYEASLMATPKWVLISMGDRVTGSGWQAREVNGAKISRWIGPRPAALLEVAIQKAQPICVRARCTGFMHLDQIAAFTMKIDGRDAPLKTWVHLGRFRYFDCVVTPDKLQAGRPLRVELDCGFVQHNNDGVDPRWLGLEFGEIEIGPAAGFNCGGPGTPSVAGAALQ